MADAPYFLFTHFVEICSFWKCSSHHSIQIFNTSFLPGAVGIRKVGLYSLLIEEVMFCKFHSIIESDRFYSYLILYLNDTFHYIATSFILEFKHTWKSCPSIYKCKNCSFKSLFRYYKVCFKVSYFTSILVLITSFFYSNSIVYFRLFLFFISLVAFITMS
jgi:hypothetical protein